MPWKCFLTEPSEYSQKSFRRYSGGSKCDIPKTKIHDAEIVIDPQILASLVEDAGTIPDEDDMSDPRWPKVCGCGYKFHVEDSWQQNVTRLYQGSPDGNLYILRDLPIGAMWDAHWLKDATPDRYTGPDGKAWCVMMPGGVEWIVYSYATGPEPRSKWAVQGTVPNITVHPSINLVGIYHGFVTSGVISEDCEQRKFEGVPRTA